MRYIQGNFKSFKRNGILLLLWEVCEVIIVLINGENGWAVTSTVASTMVHFLLFRIVDYFWVKDSVRWVDHHQRKVIIEYVAILIVLGVFTFVFAYADYAIIVTGLMYVHLMYYFVGLFALVKWLKCDNEKNLLTV